VPAATQSRGRGDRRPARLAIGQEVRAASATLTAKKVLGMSGASAPAWNQPAEAKDRSVCNACGRAGIRLLEGGLLLKGALPVMPLRIANIVMAAAL
jgi:hypothetical protein